MFPRTAVNMLRFTGTHTPLSGFIKDIDNFSKPFVEQTGSEVERL